MKKLIAEWLWRAAVLVVLSWLGVELHGIRQDLQAPFDDQAAAAVEPDGTAEELAAVNEKLDAIMVALGQMKR